MRPVDAEQGSDLEVEPEFFAQFPAHCIGGRLVGLGHATGHVPVGLVGGIDEEDATGRIADDDVGTDAFPEYGFSCRWSWISCLITR